MAVARGLFRAHIDRVAIGLEQRMLLNGTLGAVLGAMVMPAFCFGMSGYACWLTRPTNCGSGFNVQRLALGPLQRPGRTAFRGRYRGYRANTRCRRLRKPD
jgi:hypothetical protein